MPRMKEWFIDYDEARKEVNYRTEENPADRKYRFLKVKCDRMKGDEAYFVGPGHRAKQVIKKYGKNKVKEYKIQVKPKEN